MTARTWGWSASGRFALLALAIVCCGPAMARAGEPDPADGRDALAVAALEAANTRMQAKLEAARMLEAAGKRDAALAALAEIDVIHERAVQLVRELRGVAPARVVVIPGARPTAPTPTPKPVPPPHAKPPAVAAEEPELRAPKVDPVPGAVAFLLRCQGDDGLFHAALGRVAGDAEPASGTDALGTGAAVLALLDAAPGSLGEVRRAAAALASRADESGSLDADPEAHAYATWALAAAYGRTGAEEWRGVLQRAVRHALALRDPAGAWKAPGGDRPSMRVTIAMLGLLHECLALPETVPLAAEIRTAIAQAEDAAVASPSLDDPAAGFAYDLLRLSADARRTGAGVLVAGGESPLPAGAWIRVGPHGFDPLAILLGTVLARARFGTEPSDEFAAWWNGRLVPAMDLQAQGDGPGRGSWAPTDAASTRLGRVYATALALLAWKAPRAEFVDPVVR